MFWTIFKINKLYIFIIIASIISATDIEEIIKNLESINNSLFADTVNLSEAVDYVNKISAESGYNFVDTDIATNDNIIVAINKLNDDTTTNIDEYLAPEIRDIMTQSGNVEMLKNH